MLYKSNISGKVCFKIMDLGIFDRFCLSLKTRVLIDKRRIDMNIEKYVITMHRKNVWTNKCM